MPKEAFGESQIKEITFTLREVEMLLVENVKARMSTAYDFDYNNPIIIHKQGEVHLRYVQTAITRETELRPAEIKPIKSSHLGQ